MDYLKLYDLERYLFDDVTGSFNKNREKMGTGTTSVIAKILCCKEALK